jgi:hypothetical protein
MLNEGIIFIPLKPTRMLTNVIINIAITLIFLYLVVGLMVTGINEMIFAFSRLRSKCLESAVNKLFFDTEWEKISVKMKNSPFINILRKKKDLFPGNVPPDNFVSALLTTIGNGKESLEAVKKAVESQTERGQLYGLLYSILSREGITLEALRAEVGRIYDSAMDRLTGWFRTYAKGISFSIALVISVALNIDTIDITTGLWKNKEQAEKLAAFVLAASQNIGKDEQGHIILKDSTGTLARIDRAFVDVSQKPADTLETDAGEPEIVVKESAQQVRQSYEILVDLGIPMGWNRKNIPNVPENRWDEAVLWLVKILGLLLTAFATSLGAPFWYDLLKRVTPLKKTSSS